MRLSDLPPHVQERARALLAQQAPPRILHPAPGVAMLAAVEAAAAPVVLVLPFDVCVPDNARTGVLGGRALLTRRYRTAKDQARALLAEQWPGAPLTAPVALHARLWFPDARRRDAGNHRKLLTDAMASVVYADDSQVWRETWERAGIDRTTPRAEITVTPFTPAV